MSQQEITDPDVASPTLPDAAPASSGKGFQETTRRAKTGTVNKRLLAAINTELKVSGEVFVCGYPNGVMASFACYLMDGW